MDLDHDWEVEEFCAECKLVAGLDFKNDWVELLVVVGRETMKFQAKEVEVLEGRDYGQSGRMDYEFA
ncbi:MAG: hypothetical protein JW704_09770 [Anaerolineaceae bacterium]|nr:hypothetical protein [Anaerolineaceae bacterium]